MASPFNWFGWSSTSIPTNELPDIFPLGFKKELFIEIDVIAIYQKILIDVVERTQGLKEEQEPLLYDNCLKSESSRGLLHLLARAMTFSESLFVVYDEALGVIRLATGDEQAQITKDYQASNESSVGVYINFTHFRKSMLVRLYSALEYITISSLNKAMNLSTAIQFKMNDLRQSTGLNDSSEVKKQALAIAQGLANGKDVLMDAKDIIENGVPDLTAIDATIDYLCSKRAFYLGMPKTYLDGEPTKGMNETGTQDVKATERGLKNYFESIVKPVLEEIFDVTLTYKSQDFRQIDQGINALKIFALTDDELMSVENKTLIVNQLFDLDEDAKGSGKKEPGAKPNPQDGLAKVPPKA